ncbi:MAG: acylphosphatase [Chloroflexota bacterium]|nr:acylphosphatase [Chloroflexota bacterium]
MVRMTVRVRGRVQMVGYRMFAELAADRIAGISGTVQNLPDGSSVEVIAEGPRESLEEFLDELKIGPAHALVREVELKWGVASGEFARFETIT